MGLALMLLFASIGNVLSEEICSWKSGSHSCGNKEYFPGVGKVIYEGESSRNVLAFKYYNAEENILGRPMKDWLRFSVAFWHTFRGDGSDPFGSSTKRWPWDQLDKEEEELDSKSREMALARQRMHANFELLHKLGVDFWCFHDRDIAPEGVNLRETNRNLDEIVSLAAKLQASTSISPLWGTAQLFKHPRYMHGAATSPEPSVFAYAAAQAKKALEVTASLGGHNFVFWGGREGYQTLLNTDLEREEKHLGAFMRMAAEHKRKIGFEGALLLEPKPQEPTKHQYDWDAATTISFLRKYNLTGSFKLNIECNHATLSGHSCHHELEVARINGVLGNLDANTGDAQTGWDTDQFLIDPSEATRLMLAVVKNGGLQPGGINFDAKIRRESTSVQDILIAHISGMDALARGLRNAAAIIEDGTLDKAVESRYSGYDSGLGADIEAGRVGFPELEAFALANEEPVVGTGRQEFYEAVFSQFI